MATTTPAAEEQRPRLSALMRKGLEMLGGRQSRGKWIAQRSGTEKYEACALGCALIAFGYSPEKLANIVSGQIPGKNADRIIYSEILGKEHQYSATILDPSSSRSEDVISWVITKNDTSQWSVEQIAEVLEAQGY
jgi:hypothetical protein